tara:strand:- start:85 stop:585 length:501 start_codon:yes stop_codon:yes gene_type:complete
MNKQQIDRVIDKAKYLCERSGTRLTEKRRGVLELLLISNIPLSAYEITDAYNQIDEKPILAMSVYRILEFLESENLVHKLSSTNKYVACSHITCGEVHGIPQFLICGECQITREIACGGCKDEKEISISKSVIDELGKLVGKAGYTFINSQLELRVLCNNCSVSKA